LILCQVFPSHSNSNVFFVSQFYSIFSHCQTGYYHFYSNYYQMSNSDFLPETVTFNPAPTHSFGSLHKFIFLV
jgi:hypothetical protein